MKKIPDFMNARIYGVLRQIWFVLGIVCMLFNLPTSATTFFAGAIYCLLMEKKYE